jgi:hypothetical protein
MTKRSRLEQLARASNRAVEHPDTDTLAAYVLDMLSGNEQLSVAAHVRTCPTCRRHIALITPPTPTARTAQIGEPFPLPIIASLLPALSGMSAQRSAHPAASDDDVRKYVAANLQVELTISPREGDHWALTGQVLREGTSLGITPVTLRLGRKRWQAVTDVDGFFDFTELAGGVYTLTVNDAQVELTIRELQLG